MPVAPLKSRLSLDPDGYPYAAPQAPPSPERPYAWPPGETCLDAPLRRQCPEADSRWRGVPFVPASHGGAHSPAPDVILYRRRPDRGPRQSFRLYADGRYRPIGPGPLPGENEQRQDENEALRRLLQVPGLRTDGR